MSEQEDLELQALQRQLDDAFQTTRPRPNFEDELWLRMQARRPVWQRLRDALGGLIGGMREAPGVPATAVAILLIVVLGAGIVTMGGLRHGSGGATGASLDATGKNAAQPPVEYGSVPRPSFSAGSPTVPIDHGALTYSGSATLIWAGQLDVTATNLPVFRYREPTRADADQFAVSLGAAQVTGAAPGPLGTYSGDGFALVVNGTVARPAREPTFELSELNTKSIAPGSDPVRVATSYLADRSLIPEWPYQTEVVKGTGVVRILFLRSFDTSVQGQIPLVDGKGDRYGIEVDLKAGRPTVVEIGPLPLTIDSASYPIITPDQAVRAALATSAPSGGVTQYPVVRLTKAELVYVLAWAGDQSFFEPAFLFSGTFIDQGVTKVKRVLVPAVGPPFLSP